MSDDTLPEQEQPVGELSAENNSASPFEEVQSDKPTKGIEQKEAIEPEKPESELHTKVRHFLQQPLEQTAIIASDVAAHASQSLEKATGFGFYTPYDTRPSMEEFLGSTDYNLLNAGKSIITGDFSNPDVNAAMDKTWAGRIARTIGHNTYEAYKQGGIGIEPGGTTDKFFKDIGIYNDLQNNRLNTLKTIDEAFIRPVASAIDVGWRIASAAVAGGLTTISTIPEETATSIGGPAPEIVEWAMTDLPALETLMPHVPKPSDLSKGTEMGIYEGEEAYFGLDNPDREKMLSRIVAANETERLQNFVDSQKGIIPPTSATDIHTLAYQANPTVIGEYKTLNKIKDTYTSWLGKADEENVNQISKPFDERITDLQNRIETANVRKTKIYQAQLDEVMAQKEQALDGRQDTEQMKVVRGALQQADYQLRDMAPAISDAYREARKQLPQATPETQEPGSQVAPEGEQPNNAAATEQEPGSQLPVKTFIPAITEDVSRKLIKAGRPEEEANAAAELISSHYQAVSDLGWAKGTPEEIYNRDSPNIKKGRETSVTQGKLHIPFNGKNIITLFGKADASTFLHETGHHFLEEMLHYAKAGDAPTSLLSDVKTVRDWLNVKEEETISRRQHERFARGFERYLMEGRAPSQQLAEVFAKFKQWLTDIYQTVQKLRSPITDDVRDVFDRLITANPEGRTIIAPDMAREEDGLLKTENSTTPSIPAAASAATTEREISTGNNIEATTGDVPQGKAQIPASIKNTEDLQRKPFEPKSVPTEAEKAYEAPESKYLDKAGNIRLDILDVSGDVKQAIRDSAERNGNFTDWTRGKISDAEAITLAQAGGMKVDDLDKFAIGKAYNAEEIIQLQLLLNNAAADVTTATKAFREVKSEDARFDLAEKVARFEMIQDTVQSRAAGARAEAGRALHTIYAMRKLSGSVESEALSKLLKEQTGFDLFQMDNLAEAISNLDSPDKVAGYINQMRKPSKGDWTLEVFTNWLISNPVTHAIYLKSNMILALYKATAETAAEAATGAILGSKERVYLGEVRAQLYAMFKGQADGWQAAKSAFKLGQTIELPMEAVDRLTKIQRELYDKELAAGKTPEEAINAVGGVSPIKTVFTQTKAIPGTLGTLVRVPGERMVAPIHSYSRTIGYTQSIARQSYRIAVDEGLEGYEFSKRVNDLTTRPTDEMMTEARREATEQTLMGQGGELTKRISALANWEKELPFLGVTKPLRFIDPFLHINATMFEQGPLSRSPFGLLSKTVMDDIKGKNGVFAQNRRIARMSLGTSLMIATGGLTMQKLINGSGPKDPKEAHMWQMVNGMPNSFRIGDMSYDLHKLGSLGEVIGIAADLYEASEMIGKEDASKVASMLVHAVSKNFLEESSMRGPSDFMEVMNDSDRYGQKYIRNFIATLIVPYSMGTGQLAREIDPDMREVKTVMDAIKAKLPGISKTLPAVVDIWGQEIQNKDMSWLLSYEKQIKNDPVNQRLLNLNIFPAPPRRQILGVELTGQQYHDYAKMAGQMAKQELDEYVSSTGIHNIPVGEDIKMIHEIIKRNRKYAAEIISDNYPVIGRTAEANKRSISETGKKTNKQE